MGLWLDSHFLPNFLPQEAPAQETLVEILRSKLSDLYPHFPNEIIEKLLKEIESNENFFNCWRKQWERNLEECFNKAFNSYFFSSLEKIFPFEDFSSIFQQLLKEAFQQAKKM